MDEFFVRPDRSRTAWGQVMFAVIAVQPIRGSGRIYRVSCTYNQLAVELIRFLFVSFPSVRFLFFTTIHGPFCQFCADRRSGLSAVILGTSSWSVLWHSYPWAIGFAWFCRSWDKLSKLSTWVAPPEHSTWNSTLHLSCKRDSTSCHCRTAIFYSAGGIGKYQHRLYFVPCYYPAKPLLVRLSVYGVGCPYLPNTFTMITGARQDVIHAPKRMPVPRLTFGDFVQGL